MGCKRRTQVPSIQSFGPRITNEIGENDTRFPLILFCLFLLQTNPKKLPSRSSARNVGNVRVQTNRPETTLVDTSPVPSRTVVVDWNFAIVNGNSNSKNSGSIAMLSTGLLSARAAPRPTDRRCILPSVTLTR